jgi:hypothetical protein
VANWFGITRLALTAVGITEFRNPPAATGAHIEPRTSSAILPYMTGGPSQVDTPDYNTLIFVADETAKYVGQSAYRDFRRAFPVISRAAGRAGFELPWAA